MIGFVFFFTAQTRDISIKIVSLYNDIAGLFVFISWTTRVYSRNNIANDIWKMLLFLLEMLLDMTFSWAQINISHISYQTRDNIVLPIPD